MIEPEVAFFDLDDNMDLQERMMNLCHRLGFEKMPSRAEAAGA